MDIIIKEFCPKNAENSYETIEIVFKRVVGAIVKLGISGIKLKESNKDLIKFKLMQFSEHIGFGTSCLKNFDVIDNEWCIDEAIEDIYRFGVTVFAFYGKGFILNMLTFLVNENFVDVEYVKEIIYLINQKEVVDTPLILSGSNL